MGEMAEEEADALDELWTKTIPKIRKGEGGFLLNAAPGCCRWMRRLSVFLTLVPGPHIKLLRNLLP
jgi:hypothetical protein